MAEITEDTGFCQINDLVMDPPPLHISVSRQSFNHSWETLRNRNSIKVKSGYSVISVDITLRFIDYAGFDTLRKLIAELRVMPFCFIDNAFIRNSVIEGSKQESLVLAVQNVNIKKSVDTTNTIDVVVSGFWFNYKPYTSVWYYRTDMFSSLAGPNPQFSYAWKMLVEAELTRGNYLSVTTKGDDPDILDDNLTIGFREFLAPLSMGASSKDASVGYLPPERAIVEYLALKKKIDDEAKRKAQTAGPSEFHKTIKIDEPVLQSARSLLGYATSMSVELFTDIASTTADGKTYKYQGLTWEVVRNASNGSPIIKDGRPLFSRATMLNAKAAGLVVTGVSLSFKHNLTILPLIGHSLATFQHVGSSDATVAINMVATNESQLKMISHFYNAVEIAEVKYRDIPAGSRSLYVGNEIVNMCGVSECTTEQLFINTIPGQIGFYSIDMVLSDSSYDKMRESIVSEFAFSSEDVRRKIAAALLKHLNVRNQKDPKDVVVASDIPDSDSRRAKLGAAVKEYGAFLTELYRDWKGSLETLTMENSRGVTDLFSYTDDDLPGVEMVQREILNRILLPGESSPAGTAPNSKTGNVIAGSKTRAAEALQSRLGTESPFRDPAAREKYQRLQALSAQLEVMNPPTEEDMPEFTRLNSEVESAYNDFRGTVISLLHDKGLLAEQEYQQSMAMRTERRDLIADSPAMEALVGQVADAIHGLDEYEAFQNAQRQGVNQGIYDLFREAKERYAAIIDRLISLKILNDPGFSDLSRQIKDSMLRDYGGTAYPDFPMKQVVEKLQMDKSDTNHELREFLFAQWKNNAFFAKGIGPTVLVNPDFFLYNEAVDGKAQAVETAAIEKIRKVSADSLENYITAHDSWLGKVAKSYDTRIKVLARDSQKSLAFLEEGGGFRKNPAVKSEMQSRVEHQAPFDFTESGTAYSSALSLAVDGHPAVSFDERGADKWSEAELASHASSGADPSSLVSNYRYSYFRPQKDLKAPEGDQIRHIFGGAEILRGSPPVISSIRAGFSGMPDRWLWPVPTCQKISSYYGTRQDPVSGEEDVFHRGIDIIKGGVSSKGEIIIAAADGVIVEAHEGVEGLKTAEGTGKIVIQHGGNSFTVYKHIATDKLSRQWTDPSSPRYYGNRPTVRAGEPIASVGNTGYSTGAHLHFETHIGGRGAHKNPLLVMANLYNIAVPPTADTEYGQDLLERHIAGFSAEMQNGHGRGLIRAFPTFKLYFIESDFGERRKFQFDDFFSYSSVKDIQYVSTRGNPASLCIIELTNISGVLSNRKFKFKVDEVNNTLAPQEGAVGSDGQTVHENFDKPGAVNTAKENAIVSLLLQPGIQIQLRLGYNNNPLLLGGVFNGIITEVQFSESDDLVTVVAQSYGVELVQQLKQMGDTKDFGGTFSSSGDTRNILGYLMGSQELVHFGHWQSSEGKEAKQGEFYTLLTDRFVFNEKPEDQNIFPPSETFSFNPFGGSPAYKLYRTTIWDVFQEMALRHPGYVTYPLNYDGYWGPRMTMYFGLPNQLYTARDPTLDEKEFSSVLQKLQDSLKENKDVSALSESLAKKLHHAGTPIVAEDLKSYLSALASENSTGVQRDVFFKKMAVLFSQTSKHIKPVRSYHLLTSDSHIITNNISSDISKVLNAVNLEYSSHPSRGLFSELNVVENVKAAVSGPTEINKATHQLESSNPDLFFMKADIDLPDEEVRDFYAYYPNCVGEEQAKRYSLSLLWEALKKSYKGSLVIIGNENIKVGDICYVSDSYTDMYGPIEVEEVVHRFSRESGFITEIKPNMVIHINQTATMATDEAMGMIAAEVFCSMGFESAAFVLTRYFCLSQYLGRTNRKESATAQQIFSEGRKIQAKHIVDITMLSLPGLSGIKGALWLFSKWVSHTQYNHPFRFEPLVYKGTPLVRGLQSKYNRGGLFWIAGEFIDSGIVGLKEKVQDLFTQFSPENWVDTKGSFVESMFSIRQGYTGPILEE